MRTLTRTSVASLLALFAACTNAPTTPLSSNDMTETSDLARPYVKGDLIVARPYQSRVPSNYDASKPTPLVVLLHGFGASGLLQDLYWGLSNIVDDKNFLYAYPDGTYNMDNPPNRFWNATDACCGFDSTVDDVAYLDAVIADMSAQYNVDPKRIYITGHSNGGYMSYRYACDRADKVAAIVVLAGMMWKDTSKCPAMGKVAVLHTHGDMDGTVAYGGGMPAGSPSARDSIGFWAMHDGCSATSDTSSPKLDLVDTLAGAETAVEKWPGCTGGAAELWTIRGADHIPNFNKSWSTSIVDWMLAHPRP